MPGGCIKDVELGHGEQGSQSRSLVDAFTQWHTRSRHTTSKAAFVHGGGNVRDRDEVIEVYECKVARVNRHAVAAASMQLLSKYMSLWSVTWASVVLLGGFVSELRIDFEFTTSLLLVDAIRFYFVSFSTYYGTVRNSQDPRFLADFMHKKSSGLNRRGVRVRRGVGVIQLLCPLLGLVLAAFALWRAVLHPYDGPTQNNLSNSLLIFYTLQIVSGFVGVGACVVFWGMHPTNEEQSLQHWYLDTYRTCWDSGIIQAYNLNFFETVFRTLAQYYEQFERPNSMFKWNKELYEYLWCHRTGVHILARIIDQGSCFEQRAAICMVGYWPKVAGAADSIGNEFFLLQKIVDRIGFGQTGWDALRTLQAMAMYDKDGRAIDVSQWEKHLKFWMPVLKAMHIKSHRVAALGFLVAMQKRKQLQPPYTLLEHANAVKFLCDFIGGVGGEIKLLREIIMTAYLLLKWDPDVFPGQDVAKLMVQSLCMKPAQYVDLFEKCVALDVFEAFTQDPRWCYEFEWGPYPDREKCEMVTMVRQWHGDEAEVVYSCACMCKEESAQDGHSHKH